MTIQFSPAAERNAAPILDIIKPLFAHARQVLEIGSGSGQHAVHFGRHLPHLQWHTSDLAENHPGILAWLQQAQLPNVLPPIQLDVAADTWPQASFDAVFTANTCHIMRWDAVVALFRGAAGVLRQGGLLCIYGPFNYGGQFTSDSNAQFDAYLKSQSPAMGIRDAEAVNQLAADNRMQPIADHPMPANNRLLVWQRL